MLGSFRRDFSPFGIYFSLICVWALFELIHRVSSYPASFLLYRQASILCFGIFVWSEKYSIWSTGAKEPRSAQRNSVCAQWGPPRWRLLTTAQILVIACNDSIFQAKPLNVGSSDLQQQKFHPAAIIPLVSTSGSYIIFTPDQFHHWFSKTVEQLHFKHAAKTWYGYFLLNIRWTRFVH